MTATPDDFARELAELVQRNGPDGLGDRKRVVAILADRLPNAGRDLRILGMAIDNGAVVALKGTSANGAAVEIDRLAARLESHIGTPRPLSLPMLRALAFGLGRGPLPSAAAPATPDAAPLAAAAPVATTPPAAAAPRAVTAPTAAPVAGSVGGRPGAILSTLAVYWLIGQAYWLWTSLATLLDIVPIVAEGILGYFVYVIIGGLLTVASGVALAVSYSRRRRSFRVWLTIWLSLGTLVAAYALYNTIGDVIFELDAELAAGLWPLLLPTAVSLAMAALFLPYAWLAPAVRTRFVH